MDTNLLIAVLMGGPGSEREISLASGKAVVKVFTELGFRVEAIDVTSEDFVLPDDTNLAFNVIHGTFGEDGKLQASLERMGVPYTGAGVKSSRVAFDKNLAKEKFLAADVPTAKSEIVDVTNGVVLPKMSAPYVVKPPREGSSVGIQIVLKDEEGIAAMTNAAKYCNDILVEQYVAGKELTVGILDGIALPIVHIAPPDDGFYDMKNKYPWLGGGGKGSDYYCPADLSPELTKRVQDAAVRAHKSLGIEVYSRVDVLLDAAGDPYVLEANTIPGMTETSLLPKAAAAAGISFSDLCWKIANISLLLRS
jgi:D-alanine-D-alanine ligase